MMNHPQGQRMALAANTVLHAGGLRRARPGLLALFILLVSTILAAQVAVAQQGVAGTSAEARESIVNINTADAATLARDLKGVGLSRAEAIVRYRETYGPFSRAEELTEVKGIGPSTLEQNRARIALE